MRLILYYGYLFYAYQNVKQDQTTEQDPGFIRLPNFYPKTVEESIYPPSSIQSILLPSTQKTPPPPAFAASSLVYPVASPTHSLQYPCHFKYTKQFLSISSFNAGSHRRSPQGILLPIGPARLKPWSCLAGVEGRKPHLTGPTRGLRHADIAERRYVAGAFGVRGGGTAIVVGENGCTEIGAQNKAMFGAEMIEDGFPGCGGGREGGVVVGGRCGDGVEGRRE